MDTISRLDVAIAAALDAGDIAKEGFHIARQSDKTKQNANDIVTEFDIRCQDVIISQIKKMFPNDLIIAEEKGFDTTKTDTAWVIDPIDGTNPYSRQIPHFAIVIGYMKNFVAQFCVVYNPVLDELYVAELGQGCTKNDVQLKAQKREVSSMMILVEGFGQKQQLTLRDNMVPPFYTAQGMGSGAYSTTLVASGSADAYIAQSQHIWDRIHYILLTESGYKLTRLNGEPFDLRYTDYVATHTQNYSVLRNHVHKVALELNIKLQ
jgi:myo-inositol-1(or 4)-monophosphatase